MKSDHIRVLAVRQPWASLIMRGGKSYEIRTMNTNIRGPIAIYASRSPPARCDLDWLEEYGLDDVFFEDLGCDIDPFIKGAILGTVSLVGCRKTSKNWFDDNIESHMNNPDWYQKGMHSWSLADPYPITPVDFKFLLGQVVWSSIDKGLIA